MCMHMLSAWTHWQLSKSLITACLALRVGWNGRRTPSLMLGCHLGRCRRALLVARLRPLPTVPNPKRLSSAPQESRTPELRPRNVNRRRSAAYEAFGGVRTQAKPGPTRLSTHDSRGPPSSFHLSCVHPSIGHYRAGVQSEPVEDSIPSPL